MFSGSAANISGPPFWYLSNLRNFFLRSLLIKLTQSVQRLLLWLFIYYESSSVLYDDFLESHFIWKGALIRRGLRVYGQNSVVRRMKGTPNLPCHLVERSQRLSHSNQDLDLSDISLLHLKLTFEKITLFLASQ